MANFAGVLKELKQERDRLNQVIQIIDNLVGRVRPGIRTGLRRPKRVLSAAARRKISLAQKARWAKTRAGGVNTRAHEPSFTQQDRCGSARSLVEVETGTG